MLKFRNPLFEEWFGNSDKEVLKNAYKEFQEIFEKEKNEENRITVDLKNPYINPRLRLKVETPNSAKIGQIIKIKYLIENLEEENGFFTVQLDEGDDEEIVIFVNKTLSLLEFNEKERIKEFELEGLVVRSGVFRIPELIITDFKGNLFLIIFNLERKVMLMNDIKIEKSDAVQFVSIFSDDEIKCRMENNLFNQIEKPKFEEF